MIFLLASTLSLFLQAPPEAQVSDPPAPAASEQPMGTPRVAASSPSKPMRPPLLREGSFLTAARGTIGYDESIGAWTFKSVRDSGNGDDRTFGVLPTQALQDMLRTMQDRDASISFEVTGRILVYDGMNFILPTVGTPITAPEPVTSPVEPDEADQGTSDAPKNTLDDGGGDVADRLEARLRERIGALPVSSDLGVQSTETAYARTLKEGTRLQNRRGSIVRDQRSGTWRFVFDSHGGPAVDPSMELLPCLLLERLERTAAVSDLPPSVLISGEVTSFHGRNYMLPTIWRSARPGRNLIP